jgi:hypothetical protein
MFIVHVPSLLSLVVTQHHRRHLCKLFPMLHPSQHCCERTHDCACTVVVALTQIRRLTNGSNRANLIWLITREVLPPSAIRIREVIVNIFFFSVVQQLNLALGRLIVEVSTLHTGARARAHTHTHTHTHTHNPAIEWQHNFDLHRTATDTGNQPIRGSVSSLQLELSRFLCRIPTFVELARWEVQYNVVC